jgi:hypothetical protein
MQWGVTQAISQNNGPVYITFPTSFISGAFSITASPINVFAGGGGNADQIAQIVYNLGTTEGFFIMQQGASSGNPAWPITWFAVGI